MTLSDLANFIEILGVLALVFGIIFDVQQLKQHRRQRRDLAILECARSFEDREFTESYRLLSELPANRTKAHFEELGDLYESAALRVGMKFETMGLLVHRGVVPIDAMEDLVGGAALTIWRVIQPWVEESRSARSHSTFLEWYQWLVERLEARGMSGRQPVYVTDTKWKEPKI